MRRRCIWSAIKFQFIHTYELNPKIAVTFCFLVQVSIHTHIRIESYYSLPVQHELAVSIHTYIRIESANINYNPLYTRLFFIQFVCMMIYRVDQFPQLSDVKPPVTHKTCYFLVRTYQLFHDNFMFAPNY